VFGESRPAARRPGHRTESGSGSACTRAERTATAAAERAEIERVESEVKRLRHEQEQLQNRLATADALLQPLTLICSECGKETERAREQEQRARDEAAELRGQLKALKQ
jgi:chromosome segregation ATPase